MTKVVPKGSKISRLDDFGLTAAKLSRLGARQVRLSIQLKGKTLASLRHLKPKQRDDTLRQTLAKQLASVQRAFPDVAIVPRMRDKPSWTSDAVLRADQVVALANQRHVSYVTLTTVGGQRPRDRKQSLEWFCVVGLVAIQIEGQVTGSTQLEDRLMLVKARGFDDAERRLEREWAAYAKPYLNPNGYMVRWQLVSIRDVYALSADTIDPRGTEVYSRIRRARMRPEYIWRPDKKI